MGKIKLTREQADAIGWFKLNEWSLEKWINEKNYLNDLTIDEMARALYIGYEIKEEIKLGDWVYNSWNDVIRKVTNEYFKPTKYHRLATQEEIDNEKKRLWWKKHDRRVGEYKVGDLLKSKKYGTFGEVTYISNHLHKLSLNTMMYHHTDLLEFFYIACFIEDRKDPDY